MVRGKRRNGKNGKKGERRKGGKGERRRNVKGKRKYSYNVPNQGNVALGNVLHSNVMGS